MTASLQTFWDLGLGSSQQFVKMQQQVFRHCYTAYKHLLNTFSPIKMLGQNLTSGDGRLMMVIHLHNNKHTPCCARCTY